MRTLRKHPMVGIKKQGRSPFFTDLGDFAKANGQLGAVQVTTPACLRGDFPEFGARLKLDP